MKTGKIALIVIGVLVLLLIVSGIGTYNSLVGLRESVESSFSQIDIQLQRRYDLIPNLVETVKGYAKQEREVIDSITEARAKLGSSRTVEEKAQANQELSNALSRLLVVVENYPDLKSNQNFQALFDELAGTENRIGVARKDYNDIARSYNTRIRRFPASIYASIFGFDPVEYFEAAEGAREVPQVDFGE